MKLEIELILNEMVMWVDREKGLLLGGPIKAMVGNLLLVETSEGNRWVKKQRVLRSNSFNDPSLNKRF